MIFDFETRMHKLGSLRHPGFSTTQAPNCVVSSISSVLGREVGEGKPQRKKCCPPPPPVFSISPKQVWRRNPEIFQKFPAWGWVASKIALQRVGLSPQTWRRPWEPVGLLHPRIVFRGWAVGRPWSGRGPPPLQNDFFSHFFVPNLF